MDYEVLMNENVKIGQKTPIFKAITISIFKAITIFRKNSLEDYKGK